MDLKMSKKAMLIIAGASAALGLLGGIPFVGCLVCFIYPLLPVGVAIYGSIDANVNKTKVADGLLVGAIAGVISGVAYAAVNAVVSLIFNLIGVTASTASQLSQLRDYGIDFSYSVAGGFIGAVISFFGTVVFFAIVGTVTGLIVAAVREKK